MGSALGRGRRRGRRGLIIVFVRLGFGCGIVRQPITRGHALFLTTTAATATATAASAPPTRFLFAFRGRVPIDEIVDILVGFDGCGRGSGSLRQFLSGERHEGCAPGPDGGHGVCSRGVRANRGYSHGDT